MSNTTNSVDRMATRGGAKGKMSKVIAMLRSGGIAEDLPQQEDNRAANKKVKKSKGTKKPPTGNQVDRSTKKAVATKKASMTKNTSTAKEADTEIKKVATASKLAELEDMFLKKAEAAHSTHPRYWPGETPGNGTFCNLDKYFPHNTVEPGVGARALANSSVNGDVAGHLSQEETNIGEDSGLGFGDESGVGFGDNSGVSVDEDSEFDAPGSESETDDGEQYRI